MARPRSTCPWLMLMRSPTTFCPPLPMLSGDLHRAGRFHRLLLWHKALLLGPGHLARLVVGKPWHPLFLRLTRRVRQEEGGLPLAARVVDEPRSRHVHLLPCLAESAQMAPLQLNLFPTQRRLSRLVLPRLVAVLLPMWRPARRLASVRPPWPTLHLSWS